VLGQDLSTSGIFDTGVSGTSVRGVGVLGTSSSNAGVSGTSTSGSGVRGTSSSTSGVVGTTSTGTQAILGQAVNTIGVKGSTTSTSGGGTGVQGLSAGFGVGLFGQALKGTGVVGDGNFGVQGEDISGSNTPANRVVIFANGFGGRLFVGNNSAGQDVFTVSNGGLTTMAQATAGSSSVGIGVSGIGISVGVQGGISPFTTSTGFGVQGNNGTNGNSIAVRANGFGGRLFVGNNSSGRDVFIVDNNGNVFAHGFFASLAATQATSNGSSISTYSTEARAPTIEDFGEATLAAGQVYVRLDPSFASALARGQPYYVFLTPLGPNHGLYVSQRTASGFYVRETVPGRSPIAFDYRIVGKRIVTSAPQPFVTTNASKVPVVAPTFETHPKKPTIPR
jgi:hypothetical protein